MSKGKGVDNLADRNLTDRRRTLNLGDSMCTLVCDFLQLGRMDGPNEEVELDVRRSTKAQGLEVVGRCRSDEDILTVPTVVVDLG
jgi:hypothetical protein